jgi:tRNA U34 5-carboxymethylaminomethyl modifying GTPase MnmE/TrmE
MNSILKQKVVAILIGPSQTCKSSLTNNACLRRVAAIGNGSGNACTIDILTHQVQNPDFLSNCEVVIIDTRGYFDPSLTTNNKEINEKIIAHLFVSNPDLQRSLIVFLVTESLKGDRMQLRETLAELAKYFGKDAEKSTIVLGTKFVANETDIRLDEVRRVSQEEFNVKYKTFTTNTENRTYINNDEMKLQWQELSTQILALPSYNSLDIQKTKTEIETLAQKLMSEFPVSSRIEVVPYDKTVASINPFEGFRHTVHRPYPVVIKGDPPPLSYFLEKAAAQYSQDIYKKYQKKNELL